MIPIKINPAGRGTGMPALLIGVLVPTLCLGTYAFQGSALKLALFHYDMGGRASRSGIPRQSLGTRKTLVLDYVKTSRTAPDSTNPLRE